NVSAQVTHRLFQSRGFFARGFHPPRRLVLLYILFRSFFTLLKPKKTLANYNAPYLFAWLKTLTETMTNPNVVLTLKKTEGTNS
ncbi:hypothetical protein ACVGXF_00025, partial [Enterobacter hormaechei]